MFEFTRPVIEACGERLPGCGYPAPRSARRCWLGSACISGSDSAAAAGTAGRRAAVSGNYFSVAKATRDLGYRPLFTTEQAMKECLPYYTDMFDQMKANVDPRPVAVVAPAVAESGIFRVGASRNAC